MNLAQHRGAFKLFWKPELTLQPWGHILGTPCPICPVRRNDQACINCCKHTAFASNLSVAVFTFIEKTSRVGLLLLIWKGYLLMP